MDLSSQTPPPPPPVSPESIKAAAAETRFFTKKIIISLVAVVMVSGGVAAGYSVRKYLGLQKTEFAANDASSDTAATGTSSSELFDALPGADANVLLVFRATPDVKEWLQKGFLQAQQQLANKGQTIPEEEAMALLHMREVAIAAKVDFAHLKDSASKNFLTSGNPVAVAIKVEAGYETFFEKKLQEAKTKDLSGKTSYESKGNGIYLTGAQENPLQGKFSDSPLLPLLTSHPEANVSMAFSAFDVIAQALADPNMAATHPEQAEIAKKIKNIGVFGGVSKEDAQVFLKFSFGFDVTDEAGAKAFLTQFQPVLQQFLILIPKEYQAFLQTQYAAQGAVATVDVKIGDMLALQAILTSGSSTDAGTMPIPRAIPAIPTDKIKVRRP